MRLILSTIIIICLTAISIVDLIYGSKGWLTVILLILGTVGGTVYYIAKLDSEDDGEGWRQVPKHRP